MLLLGIPVCAMPSYGHQPTWLFCRYLKGSSLRIVYAYLEQNRQIDFIELYCKGEQENEDRDRIEKYLRNRKFEDSP